MAKPRKDDKFKSTRCRNRLILNDVEQRTAMALRLYAVKKGLRVGQAFNVAIELAFPADVALADDALRERGG